MRGVRAAGGIRHVTNRDELGRAAKAMAERQAARASALASERLTELFEQNRVVLGRVLERTGDGDRKQWEQAKGESATERDSVGVEVGVDSGIGRGQQRDCVQVDRETGAEQIELQVVTSE